ncbi:unnamed protein product, partial [Allacma fusca]
MFASFETFQEPHPVYLTTRNSVNAEGKGTVTVEAAIGTHWETIKISDVVFIPGAANLFSEFRMAIEGYKIVRDEIGVKYYRDQSLGPSAE